MTPLMVALRKKYKTPIEAIIALGLDPKLIEKGRAGPDVVVGDSKEIKPMAAAKPMTRVATLLMGATYAHLQPRLAKDEKLDLVPIFRRVTPRNIRGDGLLKLARSIETAVEDKLALDATPEGLHVLLEALSKVAPREDEAIPARRAEGEEPVEARRVTDPEDNRREADEPLGVGEDLDEPEKGGEEFPPKGHGEPEEGEGEEEPEEGGGEEEPDQRLEAIKSFIRANMNPEAFAKLEEMMAGLTEEGGEDDMDLEGAGKGGPPRFKGRPDVGGRVEDRRAMDEDQVQKMIRAAVDGEQQRAKALRDAEQFVFPFVGRLAVACDSAEQVFRTALKMKGIDAREVREVPALRLLLSTQKKAVDDPKPAPRVAQDSTSISSYHKMFGNQDVGFA